MAASNDNEVLNRCDIVSCNGTVIVDLPEPCFTLQFYEPTESHLPKTMPPRKEMNSVHFSAPFGDIRDLDEGITPESPTKASVRNYDSLQNHLAQPATIFSSPTLISSPHEGIGLDDSSSCGSGSVASTHDDQNVLIVRRSLCRQRLEACFERLKCLRAKSAALLARLVALTPPKLDNPCTAHVPSTISRIMTEDETESSTDDELCSPDMSSLEEQWLCTRTVTYSYWYWLQSEIRRSEQILRNLRLMKASYRKWKSEFPVQLTPGDASCSRVTPFSKHPIKRHSFHDLDSPNCKQLLGNPSFSSTGASMQCSCIPGHTGPCILCCGATPTVTLPSREPQSADLLQCARPLSGYIHSKLSLPGDIPLSLRLESRLAAPTGTVFHEHKTTAHLVDFTHRPSCIRFHTKNNRSFGPVEHKNRPVTSFARRKHSKNGAVSCPLSGNAASASRLKMRSRCDPRFNRSYTKSSNGASALRRILDLTSDSDNTDASRSWSSYPVKFEESSE